MPFTPTRGHTEEPPLPSLPAVLRLQFLMREEFSTLFPLCTHELALSTRPGAEAREILTLQEKLASAGIRTPNLTSRRFRGYQLDHRGDGWRGKGVGKIPAAEMIDEKV